MSADAAALGAPPDVLRAISERKPIAGHPKLEAIRRFADVLASSHRSIPDAERQRFLSAGFDNPAMISVAFGDAAFAPARVD